jgi:hypothetical protein
VVVSTSSEIPAKKVANEKRPPARITRRKRTLALHYWDLSGVTIWSGDELISLLIFESSADRAPIRKTAISDAIRAYSIAVAVLTPFLVRRH